MSTLTFPDVTPNEMSLGLTANTEVWRSPFTGAVQTRARGGERLIARLNWRNLTKTQRALLIAFIIELNGQENRCSLPLHAISNQGAFGGTPLVAGAGQTGRSLAIDGCSNNITGWIKAGDAFSVGTELKISTADADSNGSGETTLSFGPRLRSAPADNAAIETSDPTGTFVLSADSADWVYYPGHFTDLELVFEEDIS